MNLLRSISDLKNLKGPLHLAIGVFDGVHLGHKAVIDPVLASSREEGGDAVVVTFDPHPAKVLSNREMPLLLTSTFHKIRIFAEKLGVKNVLVVAFDEDFAAQTGAEFIESLIAASPPGDLARISVGKGWQFGKGRDGNLALLENLGEKHNFEVLGAETVQFGGVNVSSTRIRDAIAGGDFELAHHFLGREYSVLGTVIEGKKLGREFGFPTANLDIHSEQLPPSGVYAIRAKGAGDSWVGVANLGFRPTLEGGKNDLLLEVHLFGLEHEIYGEELEVEFASYLRGEEKFDGVDALKEQIAKDIEKARVVFQPAQSAGEQ